MTKEFDVAVLGPTGKVAPELVPILENHDAVRSVTAPLTEELPEFEGRDVVFSTIKNGKSAPWVAKFREQGCTVIDLSGDLRFPTVAQYERWYGRPHPAPGLVGADIVYGQPELNREELEAGPRLVSMPGCYATAMELLLYPPVKHNLIQTDELIRVDGDSGYSGRGTGADNSDLLDDYNLGHNAAPYKTGREHQHIGEVEQLLGKEELIFFAPQVLPIYRGLVIKASARLAPGATPETIQEAFDETYRDKPFVSVAANPELPTIAETADTHQCHLGFIAVRNTLFMVSTIDNLLKGAGSEAVQVFNIIHGLPEETGLTPKNGWQPAAS